MTPERIEAAALRAAHRINGRWTTDEVDIAEFAERDSAIIIEELTRHFAGDGEAIAYDEVEAMFADEAVTVSQRNGQVGVCIDHWIPLRTKGDAQIVKAALTT